MSKLRLRFVQAWVDPDGRPHHYFRRRGFKRRPLPGMPGSPAFMAEYTAAMAESPHPIGADMRSRPGTIAAAVAAYLDSTLHFGSKAKGTQGQQRSILNRFRDKYGEERLAGMPSTFIAAVLSPLMPFAARNWLKCLRGFCDFAVSQGLLKVNPCLGVKLPKVKSDGHATWTDAEIAQYEARWPVGSEQRLALALALYTAQRRGDVLRMGRQHIRTLHDDDGQPYDAIHVRQQKTGAELDIPVLPELAAILAATPTNQLTFLINECGRPYKGDAFSEKFGGWCDAAGLPDHCVFHGLRKSACRIMAERYGFTVHQIAAWSGHKNLNEIARYTKAADQRKIAQGSVARMVRREQNGTGSVKPDEPEVSRPLKRLKKKA
jgi:integrase